MGIGTLFFGGGGIGFWGEKLSNNMKISHEHNVYHIKRQWNIRNFTMDDPRMGIPFEDNNNYFVLWTSISQWCNISALAWWSAIHAWFHCTCGLDASRFHGVKCKPVWGGKFTPGPARPILARVQHCVIMSCLQNWSGREISGQLGSKFSKKTTKDSRHSITSHLKRRHTEVLIWSIV